MQTVVRGQRAVGLPFEMLADEPIVLRVGGQLGAQRRQQPGGAMASSLSKNSSQSPVAALRPMLRAAARPPFFPVNDLQAGQLGGEGVAHRAALIGGAVVHKDALPSRADRAARPRF